MDPKNKRKMAFYEIGKCPNADGGTYYPVVDEVQRAFESIQKKAEASGVSVSLSLKITSFPRKSSERYGELSFEVKETNPTNKSVKYVTELSPEGYVTATGDCAIDLDQLDLQFSAPKITAINGVNN